MQRGEGGFRCGHRLGRAIDRHAAGVAVQTLERRLVRSRRPELGPVIDGVVGGLDAEEGLEPPVGQDLQGGGVAGSDDDRLGLSWLSAVKTRWRGVRAMGLRSLMREDARLRVEKESGEDGEGGSLHFPEASPSLIAALWAPIVMHGPRAGLPTTGGNPMRP
jgi:hypothetical protein